MFVKKSIASLATGFFIFLLSSYYLFDTRLALWIDQEAPSGIPAFFEAFTQVMDTIFGGRWIYQQAFWKGNSLIALILFRYLPLMILLILTRFLDRQKLSRVFGETMLLHAFSAGCIVLLKTFIQRNRPFEFLMGSSA
ncbi:MAG: hypothetical protein AAFU64_12725, partial [Bacteroidota bacterium]